MPSLVIINLWTSKLFQFRLDLYLVDRGHSIMIVPMQCRILLQTIIQIGREIGLSLVRSKTRCYD